ncbi:hypothetical protein ACFV6Z_18545 [Streptomyces sp. NPDC059818]|uniref:hypothetical protein n=1 Tax=Streptomyces sp. NPDC059818 TaxID=3346962 RepID=UPI003664AFDB
MSTAAEPRHPSPANMPARRPVAPVTTFRELYLFGIDSSSLHAHHQLVAYGLAIHADADGEIQPQDQPRLIGLVHDTGLHAGQVAVALTTLRQRGWIRQTRRSDRYDTADFRLTIPAQLEPRLRRRAAAQPTNATSA